MDKYIKSDFFRWTGENYSSLKNIKLKRIPQYKLIYYKRRCQQYRNKNKIKFWFYSFIYGRLKIKYSADIPAKVQLGYGFVVEHLGAITINPKTVIGNNVNIYNGVTIGVEKRGERAGVPTIGNKVWIGANAIVVGNITIGDNVLIAPGSFVNVNVPSNSLVIGNPAKIINKENACYRYITNEYEGN